MANKRPLVLDDVGSGAGALREAGDGECANLINSPYCTYGGTANAITLSLNDSLGKPSAYVAGAQYRFRASAVNTGAATVNIEGLGAKALVTVTGVALPAGYIRTIVDTTITYDAVGDRFVAGREVEHGANVNGMYTRYADGSQTCSVMNKPVPAWPAGGSVIQAWNFPANFADLTGVTVTQGTTAPHLLNSSYVNPGPLSVDLVAGGSIGASGVLSATACGLWYL